MKTDCYVGHARMGSLVAMLVSTLSGCGGCGPSAQDDQLTTQQAIQGLIEFYSRISSPQSEPDVTNPECLEWCDGRDDYMECLELCEDALNHDPGDMQVIEADCAVNVYSDISHCLRCCDDDCWACPERLEDDEAQDDPSTEPQVDCETLCEEAPNDEVRFACRGVCALGVAEEAGGDAQNPLCSVMLNAELSMSCAIRLTPDNFCDAVTDSTGALTLDYLATCGMCDSQYYAASPPPGESCIPTSHPPPPPSTFPLDIFQNSDMAAQVVAGASFSGEVAQAHARARDAGFLVQLFGDDDETWAAAAFFLPDEVLAMNEPVVLVHGNVSPEARQNVLAMLGHDDEGSLRIVIDENVGFASGFESDSSTDSGAVLPGVSVYTPCMDCEQPSFQLTLQSLSGFDESSLAMSVSLSFPVAN